MLRFDVVNWVRLTPALTTSTLPTRNDPHLFHKESSVHFCGYSGFQLIIEGELVAFNLRFEVVIPHVIWKLICKIWQHDVVCRDHGEAWMR